MNKNIPYVETVKAYIQGDTSEGTALKIQKHAISGLKTQIANMEGETLNKQESIEDAEENFEKCLANGGTLMSKSEDRTLYVRKLIEAKQRVTEAYEALEDHQATLIFLKDCLNRVSNIKSEVEESVTSEKES